MLSRNLSKNITICHKSVLSWQKVSFSKILNLNSTWYFGGKITSKLVICTLDSEPLNQTCNTDLLGSVKLLTTKRANFVLIDPFIDIAVRAKYFTTALKE